MKRTPVVVPSRGFSLVEIALSLGIFSFCLIGLLGLFTVGMTQSRNSAEKVAASHLMTQMVTARAASPTKPNACALPPLNTNCDTYSAAPLYLSLTGETATTSQAAFRLNYRVTQNDPAQQGTAMEGLVRVTAALSWPPGATLENADGIYEVTFLQPNP